jgi:hypothetical protein
MGDDAHGPSLDGRVRALEDIIDGLDAEQRRTRERLADVARLAEIVMEAPGDPRLPPGRHRARRDRHGLRVIPGGLAALVPVPGHGAAALVPVAGQVWLSARNWPRWAVAALALGLAGAVAVPATADVRDHDPHAVTCAQACGAGEGGAQPLTWHPVSARRGVHRLPRGGEMEP